MVARLLIFSMLSLAFSATLSAGSTKASECAVIVHGLVRTADSMADIAESLDDAGYHVVNVDYDSREYTIPALAMKYLPPAVARCADHKPIHFVTHSMGGIMVRYLLEKSTVNNVGRIVMLAPPNHGSEVVDELKDIPGFEFMNGPAGLQLGTDQNSIPRQLGPVVGDVAVIAGTRSFNLLLSQLLPDPNDGKVSVESTRIEGMCWFLAYPATHTFIMQNDTVIALINEYLATGKLTHADAEKHQCSVDGAASPSATQ